jgi:hypothetical protein
MKSNVDDKSVEFELEERERLIFNKVSENYQTYIDADRFSNPMQNISYWKRYWHDLVEYAPKS